jgi:RNA polymerase sigma factor (sigma-70 family)
MAMRRFSSCTDAELLGATPRDPDAFAAFYRRHVGAVLAFLRSRGCGPELAADLAAEVFAAALEGVGRYDPRAGSARAWLIGTARHKLADSARRGAADDRARRRLGMAPIALTDDDLERIDALVDAARAGLTAAELTERLAPAERDAVVARVVEEREYAEIAERLACSELVVRKRVSRGLANLRAGFQGRST